MPPKKPHTMRATSAIRADTAGRRHVQVRARCPAQNRPAEDRPIVEEPLEVIAQRRRRRITRRWLLGHRLQDDCLEGGGIGEFSRDGPGSSWAIRRKTSWRSWSGNTGRFVSSSYRVAPSE